MKRPALIVISVLLAAIGNAQDSCPVDIVSAGLHEDLVQGVRFQEIRIAFTNTSGREIKGVKFKAVLFDAVDDAFDENTEYVAASPFQGNLVSVDRTWDPKRAASNKEQPRLFASWQLVTDVAVNVDVYLVKVKFADGTFWQDDGTFRCNAGVPALNIAKHGGLTAIARKLAEDDQRTQRPPAQTKQAGH